MARAAARVRVCRAGACGAARDPWISVAESLTPLPLAAVFGAPSVAHADPNGADPGARVLSANARRLPYDSLLACMGVNRAWRTGLATADLCEHADFSDPSAGVLAPLVEPAAPVRAGTLRALSAALTRASCGLRTLSLAGRTLCGAPALAALCDLIRSHAATLTTFESPWGLTNDEATEVFRMVQLCNKLQRLAVDTVPRCTIPRLVPVENGVTLVNGGRLLSAMTARESVVLLDMLRSLTMPGLESESFSVPLLAAMHASYASLVHVAVRWPLFAVEASTMLCKAPNTVLVAPVENHPSAFDTRLLLHLLRCVAFHKPLNGKRPGVRLVGLKLNANPPGVVMPFPWSVYLTELARAVRRIPGGDIRWVELSGLDDDPAHAVGVTRLLDAFTEAQVRSVDLGYRNSVPYFAFACAARLLNNRGSVIRQLSLAASHAATAAAAGVFTVNAAARSFCDALRDSRTLLDLNLERMEILAPPGSVDNGRFLDLLVDALEGHPSLRSFAAYGVNCGTGAAAARTGAAVARLLAANTPGLLELRISNSLVSQPFLKAVYGALQRNTHIRNLIVDSAVYTASFARRVMLPAVKACRSLRVLKVYREDHNDWDDYPAEATASALVAARLRCEE